MARFGSVGGGPTVANKTVEGDDGCRPTNVHTLLLFLLVAQALPRLTLLLSLPPLAPRSTAALALTSWSRRSSLPPSRRGADCLVVSSALASAAPALLHYFRCGILCGGPVCLPCLLLTSWYSKAGTIHLQSTVVAALLWFVLSFVAVPPRML